MDAATLANGCLEMAVGQWWGPGQVPLTPQGTVEPEFEKTINFQHLTCENIACITDDD